MLREAKILCPLATNEGESLTHLHDTLAEGLVDDFGGCTMTPCLGFWRSPDSGKVHREPMLAFVVAVDWAQAGAKLERAVANLRFIAEHVARIAKQECVYLQLPSGAVEFVKASNVTVAAHEAAQARGAPVRPFVVVDNDAKAASH